jgi:hypothetical protein
MDAAFADSFVTRIIDSSGLSRGLSALGRGRGHGPLRVLAAKSTDLHLRVKFVASLYCSFGSAAEVSAHSCRLYTCSCLRLY